MKEGSGPTFFELSQPFEAPNKGKAGVVDLTIYDKLGKGNTPFDDACWEEGVESSRESTKAVVPPEPEDHPGIKKLPKHHYPEDAGEPDWQNRKDLE